jgi:hypothetical protein
MGKVFGKVTKYPGAGNKWTQNDESELRDLFDKAFSMDEMVAVIGRGPGGILLRLKKLNLVSEELDILGFNELIKNQREKLEPVENLGNIESIKVQILHTWEKAHWQLNQDQRGRFLNHPTLMKLIKFRPEYISDALTKIRLVKLDEIYGYVCGREFEEKDALGVQRKINKTKLIAISESLKEVKNDRKTQGSSLSQTSTSRGRESFKEFGMINPPPAALPDLSHTSIHNCSICAKPVVGNTCACDGW